MLEEEEMWGLGARPGRQEEEGPSGGEEAPPPASPAAAEAAGAASEGAWAAGERHPYREAAFEPQVREAQEAAEEMRRLEESGP